MTTGWGGAYAAAYEIAATTAEDGWPLAAKSLDDLGADELAEMVSALGAHARQAAYVASGPGAGAIRAAQKVVADAEVHDPGARAVVMAALDGEDVPAAPAPALTEAATALVAVIMGTLQAAGMSARQIAVICRRAAAQ